MLAVHEQVSIDRKSAAGLQNAQGFSDYGLAFAIKKIAVGFRSLYRALEFAARILKRDCLPFLVPIVMNRRGEHVREHDFFMRFVFKRKTYAVGKEEFSLPGVCEAFLHVRRDRIF